MSNQLQHRLLNIEVEPPAKMWDAINEALNDQNSIVADKLLHFEQTPKAHLWENINQELDHITDVDKVVPSSIPFYKRYARPLRYGSAVAILAFLAITISLLLNKGAVSNELTQQSTVSNTTNTVARASKPSVYTETNKKDKDQLSPSSESQTNSIADFEEIVIPASTTTRYMTVASETGKPVRLSKKAYEVFNCAENSQAALAYRCKENITSLQQKAASAFASPSGDFASLMDMIKELEENH